MTNPHPIPDAADAAPASAGDAATPGHPAAQPIVYFDGGCPLCRAEIATYRQTPGGERLNWVDATNCTSAELGAGLGREAALARMHVRRADGTLVQGAAAFAEIWAHLPRWSLLARIARVPGVLGMLELAYRVFLRIRPLWRGRSRA